jgi:hypothetical protein
MAYERGGHGPDTLQSRLHLQLGVASLQHIVAHPDATVAPVGPMPDSELELVLAAHAYSQSLPAEQNRMGFEFQWVRHARESLRDTAKQVITKGFDEVYTGRLLLPYREYERDGFYDMRAKLQAEPAIKRHPFGMRFARAVDNGEVKLDTDWPLVTPQEVRALCEDGPLRQELLRKVTAKVIRLSQPAA